jgi:hypothetical protein
MAGYIHIFRNEVATGTYGAPVIAEYQLNYVAGGKTFGGTMNEGRLEEFLVHDVGFTIDTTAEILDRVRLHGNVTLPDVEIRENEASAAGLRELPSDY